MSLETSVIALTLAAHKDPHTAQLARAYLDLWNALHKLYRLVIVDANDNQMISLLQRVAESAGFDQLEHQHVKSVVNSSEYEQGE